MKPPIYNNIHNTHTSYIAFYLMVMGFSPASAILQSAIYIFLVPILFPALAPK